MSDPNPSSEPLSSSNSGSLYDQLEVGRLSDNEVKGENRILAILAKELDALREKVRELEAKKIIEETQIPVEILEGHKILPPPIKRTKSGNGYRPLLKSEIEEAKKHSPFGAGQAKWLGVHVTTYRKYAKLYGLWEPKPNEKGKRNLCDPYRGKHPLNEILEGKHPNLSVWKVKDKLIRSGTKKAVCEICGYDKRRLGDGKVALLLTHKDGNIHNHTWENLQILCLNCTFECGRGYIRNSKYILDPEWMQGASINEIDDKSRF